jgi:hypothetical protein
MKLTQRDIEVFKLLNRYRYLRRTFIHVLLGAPLHAGRLRHRIGDLAAAGYLRLPVQQKNTANYNNRPAVYELGPKGKAALEDQGIAVNPWSGNPNEFWHQLMISDVVASIEIAAKWKGLTFKTRWEILGDRPFHLTGHDGQVRPDELFAVDGTHFALEADRATESNNSPLTRNSSWAKKVDQYVDVFKNRTYQREWGIQSLIVLNMFTSPRKADNVRRYIEEGLDRKSRSLWFRGMKVLGSHDSAPQPLTAILDDLWHRAGHEPVAMLSALERRMDGHTKAA